MANTESIRRAMSYIGSQKSPAKSKTSAENAKKGHAKIRKLRASGVACGGWPKGKKRR